MSGSAARTLIVLLALAGATGAANSRVTTASLDDFEDRDLIAATGSAWVPIADDLFGGRTTLRLEPRRGGSDGSRGVLRVSGTIGDGPNAFGGAWTPVVEGGRAADLSRFSGIRMRLRGSGDVLVGVRRGPFAKSVNFMGAVTADNDWSTLEIPFSRLRPQGKGLETEVWDPRDARWFGVQTVPGTSGPFAFEIDEVAWVAEDMPARAPVPADGEPPTSRALIPDEAAPLRTLPWRELALDGEGDQRPGLPDARALYVAPDRARSLTWFRIDLQQAPPDNWIGVNLAVDSDGEPGDGPAWWGKNTEFHFDRLVSAWVFRVADHYEGIVGIASGDDLAAMRLTNEGEVHLALDRARKRVYVGVPEALIEGEGTRVVAAVGSAMFFSDDLPDVGAALLDPTARPKAPAAGRPEGPPTVTPSLP